MMLDTETMKYRFGIVKWCDDGLGNLLLRARRIA